MERVQLELQMFDKHDDRVSFTIPHERDSEPSSQDLMVTMREMRWINMGRPHKITAQLTRVQREENVTTQAPTTDNQETNY